MTSIFVSYNPDSDLERSLAFRLHTIGSVNGFQMHIPDRRNGGKFPSESTMNEIALSQWYILFSTRVLSETVKSEISYALLRHNDPRKIVVVYSASRGRTTSGLDSCTEEWFDPRTETPDSVITRLLNRIGLETLNENHTREVNAELRQVQSERNGLAALLGVGVGLFVLSLLSEDEKKPPRKRTARKKKNG